MDLSIIVPVYNVEKYLDQCLSSILKQKENNLNFEVIIINDGSQDNSFKIATFYLLSSPFVKIITQENKGLSTARNIGLEKACGRYVWFIDSDDWINENSFNILSPLIKDGKVDAITFSTEFYNNGIFSSDFNRKNIQVRILNGVESLKRSDWACEVPFTIYRRNFLNEYKLKMKPNIYHEDIEFSPQAYFYLKSIYFIEETLYFVRVNPLSITRTYNLKKNFDLVTVAESIFNFYTTKVPKNLHYIFIDILGLVLNGALYNNNLMDKKKLSEFKKIIDEKNFLFRELLQASNKKYKIEGFCYSLFPKHIIKMHNLLSQILAFFKVACRKKVLPF